LGRGGIGRGSLAAALLVGLAAPAVAPRAYAADVAPPAVLVDPFDEDSVRPDGFPDPLEGLNRAVFRFNLTADRWVIDPVARAYAFAVPDGVRRGIRRALANLNSPSVFVNDVLQLEPRAAGVTAARFVVNTTVGLLGTFDPAAPIGLEAHDADFGQTLALAGVPSGAYLILPVVGPTTVRDATGYLVDFLFRPATYVLTPGAQIVYTSIEQSSAGIAARDAHADALRALEAASIDFYAALRNAFYQDRVARIWARRSPPRPTTVTRESPSGDGALGASRREVPDLAANGGE
jgi:phospholipid-binding lipoprotein MlaA